AQGGRIATTTIEGRERHSVRVRFARDYRQDEESLRALPLVTNTATDLTLEAVADIGVLQGPASIKSENGLLRNYVRLNVRGRDAEDFVAEVKPVVASQVTLPPGVFVEWTGRFEQQARAGRTLFLLVPLVALAVFLILWWTYRDLADAVLIFLTVPAVIAG